MRPEFGGLLLLSFTDWVGEFEQDASPRESRTPRKRENDTRREGITRGAAIPVPCPEGANKIDWVTPTTEIRDRFLRIGKNAIPRADSTCRKMISL